MSENCEHEQLFSVISKLSSPEEVGVFLTDLCSLHELDSMAQRLNAAKLLLNGKTYENIIKETGISSKTLSRISKCVKQGRGYSKLIK